MNLAPKQMPEEQAVSLVRNALLVAGMEMGADGDHWPVIKSTIHSVVKDWEDLKIERDVSAELKEHIGAVLNDMEASLVDCPAHALHEAQSILKELRDLYDARFSLTDTSLIVVCDAEIPIHVQRTRNILKSLEDENE
jgi:hypothetical protein